MDSTIFAILVALRHGACTAPLLLERLEEDIGMGDSVPVATFYRRLKATLGLGWVLATDDEPAGPGRPGKRYALTDAGRSAARKEARRLQYLASLALGDESLKESQP